MDKLSVLLLNAAGISVVVKLLIDLVKHVGCLTGRATQIVTVAIAVFLAVAGAALYAKPPDFAEAVWLGVQAAAMSVGLDQALKRAP